MKKIIALILVLVMACACLTACGGTKGITLKDTPQGVQIIRA